jgi:hypothetical protein
MSPGSAAPGDLPALTLARYAPNGSTTVAGSA